MTPCPLPPLHCPATEDYGLLVCDNNAVGLANTTAQRLHDPSALDIKCPCHNAHCESIEPERQSHPGHQERETGSRRNIFTHWRQPCRLTHSFQHNLLARCFDYTTAIMVAVGISALLLALSTFSSVVPSSAAPVAQAGAPAKAASSYWVANIKHQGQSAFNPNPAGYKVFRNVKDYGAKGDGATDDTAAINKAIEEGNRCGEKCDSSTTSPALIYFPAGTYMISKPIIQYYYSSFIGDALQMPTLKATASFKGMGLIDADPYIEGGYGANWYTNQNNFYRQIRNFIIDISAPEEAAGVHWQVSQATSIQNVVFNMAKGAKGAKQKGIFQDNGSGGFMSDLVFNGGAVGAFLGSQQFTTRNMTFNECDVGIYMNWNWLWTMKSNTFNKCKVGLDMANAPENQTVGSVILMDSKFVDTPIGVNSSFSQTSIPKTGGTLIIDNVDFAGSKTAVQDFKGASILAGGKIVSSWAQGHALASGAAQSRVQGDVSNAPKKPASLLGKDGKGFFERSKPQYETVDASKFKSLKDAGAKGDGKTDDTEAIKKAIAGLQEGEILFADHGSYVVSDTITIPAAKKVKIVGEVYSTFLATGAKFGDMENPKPVWQVGEKSGDKGAFEMSDCIIGTQGPAPGAILMEWNINAENGEAGLWDTHFRVGGYEGTKLQASNCQKNPNATHGANPECIGSFMQLHVTKQSNGYFENVWLWTADHELDQASHSQIDIYNGRGMLVESQGPVWFYGTASEHSQLYQYQFQGAKDIFYGAIQTETPYYQPNPEGTVPFKVNAKYFDPDLSKKSDKTAWAVRIVDSSSIWSYGAGTYSFFQNYGQECVAKQNCQTDINEIENSTNVNIYGLSSKASVNMMTSGGKGLVKDQDNRSNFCATLAIFAQP